MTEAEQRLREAVAIEKAERQTHEQDRARYEAAALKLVAAVDAGGGFADDLAAWLRDADRDPLIDLLARADPWNRAALLEVVAGFRRFGVAAEVALRLPKPAEDYKPFPIG